MSAQDHDGAACSGQCASVCDHSDCVSCRRAKRARVRTGALKTLKNPGPPGAYSVASTTEELTFMGKIFPESQPDFAELTIAYSPGEVILELKSLKKYVLWFRDELFSYERLCNTIYEEVKAALGDPAALVVTLSCNPRGGIKTIVQRGE